MRRPIWWVVILAALFALGTGWLQWWKYERFGYNGLDLGIYTQTVWSLSQGHGFANSIHDPSYLGDHLELVLVPIAGLYRLWPSPLVLLWFQTLCLAISGILLFRLAQKYLPDRAALLAAGLWLIHPFIYNPALYEFHGLTTALPVLLAAIVAYQGKKWAWWVVWLTILCLIREDLPLVAISWVVLAIADRVPWRWWVTVAVLSIGWFIVSHLIIAEANALGEYKYTAFVSWLGETPLEMLTYPFRHPLLFLGHILGPKNWGTALGLLVGFGVICLLRIRLLIPVALTFAQTAVIGSSPNSVLHLHYVIPFIPFLAWATFETLAAARRGKIWPTKNQEMVRLVLIVLAVSGPLYLHTMYGPGELPWKPTPFAEPTPVRDLRPAVNLVQPTDRVLTTFNLLPHLASRQHVYSLNYIYLGRRQYTEERYTVPTPIDVAVIDWRELYDYQFLYRETLFEGRTGEQRIRDLLAENSLAPVYQSGSVIVYRAGGTLPATGTVAGPAATPTDPGLTPTRVTAQLLNNAAVIDLAWSISETPDQPVSIQFSLVDASGRQVVSSRLLGEGGLPATDWQPHQEWQTSYHFSLPAGFIPVKSDIVWVELRGRYHLDRLRSFHRIVSGFEQLGQTSVRFNP